MALLWPVEPVSEENKQDKKNRSAKQFTGFRFVRVPLGGVPVASPESNDSVTQEYGQ
jgi:hypothetical protein